MGVIASAMVAFPTSVAASPCTAIQATPQVSQDSNARAAVVCLINVERSRAHLPGLRTNASLATAAAAYSERMVAERFFAHIDPRGGSIASRAKTSGYLKGAWLWGLGENLAWGVGSRSTPNQIVAEWMASPGHRANILERSWRELGVGVAIGNPVSGSGGGGATYAVEFGQRTAHAAARPHRPRKTIRK